MDPNQKLDFSQFPHFILILMIVAFVYYALKTFNKKFPQVAEKIKDTTPWMGWVENDYEAASYRSGDNYRNWK